MKETFDYAFTGPAVVCFFSGGRFAVERDERTTVDLLAIHLAVLHVDSARGRFTIAESRAPQLARDALGPRVDTTAAFDVHRPAAGRPVRYALLARAGADGDEGDFWVYGQRLKGDARDQPIYRRFRSDRLTPTGCDWFFVRDWLFPAGYQPPPLQ